MYENQINLVYIKMFIFLIHQCVLKLASIQTLFHSYRPSLDFFGQMMHFCKSIWVDFIKNIFKALINFFIRGDILVSFVENMPKTCFLKVFFLRPKLHIS